MNVSLLKLTKTDFLLIYPSAQLIFETARAVHITVTSIDMHTPIDRKADFKFLSVKLQQVFFELPRIFFFN